MGHLTAVTGAAGVIGRPLCAALTAAGATVRAVDNRGLDGVEAAEKRLVDLRDRHSTHDALRGAEHVFHLASETGGIAHTERDLATTLAANMAIDGTVLGAAMTCGVKRLFYASSACVYPMRLQQTQHTLCEFDAGDDPQPGFGHSKLYGESLALLAQREGRLQVRIGRIFTVYGPGERLDGDGKIVGMIARRVAQTPDGGEVVVWGDGHQSRTIIYIDDCVSAIMALMAAEGGNSERPVNITTSDTVTPRMLVSFFSEGAAKQLHVVPDLTKPRGVPHRLGGVGLMRTVLKGWEPRVASHSGLRRTYAYAARGVSAS